MKRFGKAGHLAAKTWMVEMNKIDEKIHLEKYNPE
jgi:hypothetical protein